MKVMATKPGYLGKLRQPGDEFEVPTGTKGSWFQAVERKDDGRKPDAPAGKKPVDDLV